MNDKFKHLNIEILLANPRGFCVGVDRAIEIVNRALDLFGAPIYVKHEVVHNRYVVDGLKSLGVKFIENLNEVLKTALLYRVPMEFHRMLEEKPKNEN